MKTPLAFGRRRVLRGMLGAGAVTVGLPILDCFLNTNGTAFAESGAPLPVCFGTWFWGLGFGEGDWAPTAVGVNFELPRQLQVLAPYKSRFNLYTGLEVFLDGKSNRTHFSGVQAIMTGEVTVGGSGEGTYHSSLDTLISDVIGNGTPFRSIEVACDGNPKSTWSARTAGAMNPAEVSPESLYKRIFGPEFVDPNAATFAPDPTVMVRESVLSGVAEERRKLMKAVGASDRVRLDQFFSSVRALEHKLELALTKPAPLEACSKPDLIKNAPKTTLVTDAMETHDLFAELLAHALACGQTRVFNLCVSEGMSGLYREGDTTNHHSYSHEELIDPKLGYQPICAWFSAQYIKGLHDLIAKIDGIPEGPGTLLDRTLVLAFTDHGQARVHSLRNYPFLTIGNAQGRMKTGLHVSAVGDAATRVGLTVQHALGIPVGSWGKESNRVSQPFSEVLA